MKHIQHLLAEPTTDGLSDVLRTQHRLVEEMLFRTIELTALVDSGQHRFIGRALDDLDRAERELGRAEMVRAAMTEAIVGSRPGHEPRLSEVIAGLDDETAQHVDRTAEQIRTTLEKIEQVRKAAASTAAERVSRARRAMSAATSESGLYGRS